jgi:hypothetical protein
MEAMDSELEHANRTIEETYAKNKLQEDQIKISIFEV